jgi:hypothetical protein
MYGGLEPPSPGFDAGVHPQHLYNFAPFRTAMLVGQDKFQTALDCRHQPKVLYKILMNLLDKQDCFITFNTVSITPF